MKKVITFVMLLLILFPSTVYSKNNNDEITVFKEIQVGGMYFKVAWITPETITHKEIANSLDTFQNWTPSFTTKAKEIMEIEPSSGISYSSEEIRKGLTKAISKQCPVLWVELINNKMETNYLINPIQLVRLPDRIAYGKEAFILLPEGTTENSILPLAKETRIYVYHSRGDEQKFLGGILVFDVNFEQKNLQLFQKSK